MTYPKSNSNDSTGVCTLSIEGEVLQSAVLDAYAMCSMNYARLERKRLEYLVRNFIIPLVGGYQPELGDSLDRHLKQVRTFSGNFCWRHRHLGASYGVVGHRAGIDEGAQHGH